MAAIGRLVKESMINELTATLAERSNVFVTRINRLPAAEADALRLKLFASKATLVVIKRRLGARALEALKIPGVADLLEGSLGLVVPGDDVLPAAKVIVEFIKTHEEQLAVRGGVVDGQVLDKSRVEQLASLPAKPILLAHVVLTLESPITDVIFTLERLIGDLAWLAEQAAAMRSAPAAAPAPEPASAPPQADAGSAPAPS